MNTADFSTTIVVDRTPIEVFNAVNNVTQWWTENLEGDTHHTGDEFTVRFGEVHVSTQKIVEFIPDKKVSWLVTNSRLNFISDKQEWTGTKICFEISELNNKTEIRFTHFGLVPGIECFGACSNAWSQYIQQSLYSLLMTGKGQPTPKEESMESKKFDG
jgi:hypothetical protein